MLHICIAIQLTAMFPPAIVYDTHHFVGVRLRQFGVGSRKANVFTRRVRTTALDTSKCKRSCGNSPGLPNRFALIRAMLTSQSIGATVEVVHVHCTSTDHAFDFWATPVKASPGPLYYDVAAVADAGVRNDRQTLPKLMEDTAMRPNLGACLRPQRPIEERVGRSASARDGHKQQDQHSARDCL